MIDFPVANQRLIDAQARYSDGIKNLRDGYGMYQEIGIGLPGEIDMRVRLLGIMAGQAQELAHRCADLAMAVAVMDHVTRAGEEVLSCFREETDEALFSDDERAAIGMLYVYAYLQRINDFCQRIDNIITPENLRERMPRTVAAARAYLRPTDEMKAATGIWSSLPSKEE